jgi:hypothetical protein
LLALPSQFPCASVSLSDGFIKIRIVFRDSDTYVAFLDNENVSSLETLLVIALWLVRDLSMTTSFTMVDLTLFVNLIAISILNSRTCIAHKFSRSACHNWKASVWHKLANGTFFPIVIHTISVVDGIMHRRHLL